MRFFAKRLSKIYTDTPSDQAMPLSQPSPRAARLLLFAMLAIGVMACALLTGCASYLGAIAQTASDAVKPSQGGDSARLSPLYQYLRVTLQGRVVFVALGNIDQHVDGPVEVYYSSGREVVRLQNGHLVGAAGVLTEWRNVSIASAPSWIASRSGQPITWQRVRDVMPGYRFGIPDNLVRSKIPPPPQNALQDIRPETLEWFEERHIYPPASRSSPVNEKLPPAKYAVAYANGKATVVYAEQCLAPDLCLSWQRWTPKQS